MLREGERCSKHKVSVVQGESCDVLDSMEITA